ncbi:MAG: NADH-quinone oxidoreductase subunit N [Deltaproteobacteria bacterium]|nr:NADH-quinone oxidoreductase subunit N [Deltaproteobacteria bacterium]
MLSEFRSLAIISPELMLFATAILTLLADISSRAKATARGRDGHEISSYETRPRLVAAVALLGLAAALLLSFRTFSFAPTEVFSRALSIDPVSQFFKTLLIFAGIITVMQGSMSHEIHRTEKAELHALLVLGTLGMCIMTSAVHFLLLFLAYEMVGITGYVLAAFKRRSGLSSEAGVKLFVHGALTTILFAIGIVMLYGIGKSFNILDIRGQLTSGAVPTGYLWVAFGLIFIALAGRLAVFPFHFLAPDIIEGSPSPVSAYFCVSSTIAAMAFALRLCIHIFSAKGDLKWIHLQNFEWPELSTGVAAVTMTIGNLTALYQTNLKRLIGYSCIAQIGYILMGIPVLTHAGIAAVLFSLATYGIVTLGTFFVIQMVTDHAGSEKLSILRGLVWRNPYEGVALCIFLLSLAGLPPLVGFVGRFYILGVVVREKLYWLSIVAAINWVLGLTYYLSMIRQIFASHSLSAGERSPSVMEANPVAQFTLAILLLPTIVLGIYWDPLMNYITRSLGAVAW